MHRDHQDGHLAAVRARRGRRDLAKLLAEQHRDHRGVDEDRDRRAPPEGGDHERKVEAPLGGDHQHGRRRVGREHAADRHVDEQHTDGRVLQSLRNPLLEDRLAQQQRPQRHRRRLGDERAQQRDQRQRHEVGGHRAAKRDHRRHHAHPGAGHVQDRPARRDHHDREHEQRLGVVAAVEVLDARPDAVVHRDDDAKDQRPEAEHAFHLGEQVPGARVRRVEVGESSEELGREGVDDRDGEEHRGDEFGDGYMDGCHVFLSPSADGTTAPRRVSNPRMQVFAILAT